ncbi:MAG: cytochrome c oxidase subunit II [Gemmatimonadales bacterium]
MRHASLPGATCACIIPPEIYCDIDVKWMTLFAERSLHGLKCLPALLLVVIAAGCGGEFPQSTLHPTADFGYEVDDLFRIIFWWAVVVFVVVEVGLLYIILRFRERSGSPEPRRIHGSTLLEVAWTLAPALVLVFIAVPTIRTIIDVSGRAPDDALVIDVIGHQWWWEYRYLDFDITTANEVHVPQGRTVQFRMTSVDVIHSFWVPKIGGKRDVLPGRTTYIAFTPDSIGTFFGQCAEFCGVSHANMGLRLMVDSPSEFADWIRQEQNPPPPTEALDTEAQRGFEAFTAVRDPGNHSCLACHVVEGVTFGVLGPNLTHVGSRTTIAGGVLPMTADGLAEWLRDPLRVKPGSLMPDIDLTEEEISALVAYLSTLR